jgi:hypothetical protein
MDRLMDYIVIYREREFIFALSIAEIRRPGVKLAWKKARRAADWPVQLIDTHYEQHGSTSRYLDSFSFDALKNFGP